MWLETQLMMIFCKSCTWLSSGHRQLWLWNQHSWRSALHPDCLWTVNPGALALSGSAPLVALPLVLSSLQHSSSTYPWSSCGPDHHAFPLNTSVKRSLWPLKPETSASALATNIHYLMTPLFPWEETLNPFVLREHRADVSCDYPPLPFLHFRIRQQRPVNQAAVRGEFLSRWLKAADSCFLSLLLRRDNSVNRLWTADKGGRGWGSACCIWDRGSTGGEQ